MILPRIETEPRFTQPIMFCLDEPTREALDRYNRKRHRRKLKPVSDPLPSMETREEVEGIMRENREVAR